MNWEFTIAYLLGLAIAALAFGIGYDIGRRR